MSWNPVDADENKMIRLVFLLLSIAIHRTSEQYQSHGSNHNVARLIDAFLKLPNSPRLQRMEPPSRDPEINKHAMKDKDLYGTQNPDVQGSIVPQDENLEKQFLLSFGRQNTECTCIAVLLANNEGSCGTTCFNSETQCGQICTRTTTFSAFTNFAINNPIVRQFSRINEKACDKLGIDCITSSLLSVASSSSAIAATASVVANIALAAGIAAGIAALAIVAKKDPQSDDGHYFTTEAPYATEAEYFQAYARALFPETHDGSASDDLTTLSEDKFMLEDVAVEGSIRRIEENSYITGFRRVGRQASCKCDPFTRLDSACTTECVSSTEFCDGRLCTVTTSISTFQYLGTFTSFIVTNEKDCDTLENACTLSFVMSSALSEANARSNAIALNAGIAGVLSAGLAGGNIAAVTVSNSQQTNNNANNQRINDNSNNQVPQPGNLTPTNDLPSPVTGSDFPDDGAGYNSIQFEDGERHPVLTRGPCNETNFWVTVSPITLKGGCTPKLCDDSRVFVGRTGLCHVINDPLECQGGRRLYYTAYGDPICDCPVGKYPFPNPTDNCVALFSRGPCPDGQMVTLSQGGQLFCTPAECQTFNDVDDSRQQFVPTEKGECFALGSVGPCSTPRLLAYDIFSRQLQCINITDPFSPYFNTLSQEGGMIDRVMPAALMSQKFHSINIDFQSGLHQQNEQGIITRKIHRQDANTAGIFQLPSSLPDPLLQSCRTGARRAENFKCTNPLISDSSNTGRVLPPVNPNFSCPASTFLQATGQCVDDSRSTSCGPSMQFNEATGQCRSVF